jgi:hypothetical protein
LGYDALSFDRYVIAFTSVSMNLPASIIHLPRLWRQQILPKLWCLFTKSHSTYQKTILSLAQELKFSHTTKSIHKTYH